MAAIKAEHLNPFLLSAKQVLQQVCNVDVSFGQISKDDYYSCKIEAPYEVYVYVERKNASNYFMKVISPKMKIPGLTFSWKRAIGITQAKQKIARATGIPMTKQGLERKIGNTILKGAKKLIK